MLLFGTFVSKHPPILFLHLDFISNPPEYMFGGFQRLMSVIWSFWYKFSRKQKNLNISNIEFNGRWTVSFLLKVVIVSLVKCRFFHQNYLVSNLDHILLLVEPLFHYVRVYLWTPGCVV